MSEIVSPGTTAFALECAGTNSLGSEDSKSGRNTFGATFKHNVPFQFAVAWTMPVCHDVARCL